jgi:glutathione S-transferase
MITIHHLLVSQSERVIWLMEELGLPYELKSYPRQPNYMAAPEFLALHPIGQAPVIEDGDVVLAESLAITIYILELYGKGALRIVPGEPGYADYIYWLTYSVGGLMPQAMQYMAALRTGTEDGPYGDMMRERRHRHLRKIHRRRDHVPVSLWHDGEIRRHGHFRLSQYRPLAGAYQRTPGVSAGDDRGRELIAAG